MKFKILVLLLAISSIINAQNCLNMIYKYDSELMEENMKKDEFLYPLPIQKNGWTILMYSMTYSGAYYDEYPSAPDFYIGHRLFHPNGMIKAVGKSVGRFSVGIWTYYDEEGRIIKEENEGLKFGKIKIEDVLKFLHKEKHIDLKTGWGREDIRINENGSASPIPSHFALRLIEDDNTKYWEIEVFALPWNGWHQTIYHIHPETGKVLFKEKKRLNYTL